MTSKILFLILMSAFFFVTMILHRSRRQFMTRFYLRMTALVTARKLYRLMLLILLYVFHFIYLCVHYNDIGVVASTIAFAIFFVFMDVERWLQRLHEERTPFCIAALAAVVFVFSSSVHACCHHLLCPSGITVLSLAHSHIAVEEQG